ncbi:MAG: dTMP kinase [Burkholderiales bacterium]|nr:dTMP kinase [Burkholderiales bacterium]
MSGQAARGKFVTLEGIDGAGKSTHLQWLAERLRAQGRDVVVTREPGGTPLGERLREIILHEAMDLDTEALLVFAARQEHIRRVIAPSLAAGTWVVSDRFTDATFAYQGGGRGIPFERLEVLETWVQQGLQPDLTLFFDVPVAVGQERLRQATAAPDRFEREQAAFFERVRSGYLRRAAAAPERFRIVDSSRPLADVKTQLELAIAAIC